MAVTAAEAESVVIAFVRAMNEWERAAWSASRAARNTDTPNSYYSGVAASLQRCSRSSAHPVSDRTVA
jgi:hypothetical protein